VLPDLGDIRRLAPRGAGARDHVSPAERRGSRHRRRVRPFGVRLDLLPCHRLVLSLSETDDITRGIPESAQVALGPNGTSGYTMSLFDLAGGTGTRTWGDLLRAVHGTEAAWRRELDSRFLLALDEQLFPPIEGRMRAGATSRGQERVYRPILYSIVRGPTVGPGSDDATNTDRQPRSVTVVLDPNPLAPIAEAIDPRRQVK